MRKSHSTLLKFLGVLFLATGLISYTRGSPIGVVLPTTLIGVLFFATLAYNIASWKHFVLLLGPWVMIILSMTSFVTVTFLPAVFVSTWFIYYPSIIALYIIARHPKLVSKVIRENFTEGDEGWMKTRLAALDTLFAFGSVILIYSAMNSFDGGKIGIGFMKDWREFYVYGAAMVTYVTMYRTKYNIETMGSIKAMSIWFGMVSGVFLLFRSLVLFTLFTSMGLNSFLFEAFLGISIIFVTMKTDDTPIKDIVG